jgi:diguanylate cyclase (GGDEF)-like protein
MNRPMPILATEPPHDVAEPSLAMFRSSDLSAIWGNGAAVNSLLAITLECGRIAAAPDVRLDHLTQLVGGDGSDIRRTCRIEFEGLTYWSPRYSPAEVCIERPIESFGEARGRVTIGYPGLTKTLAEGTAERAWAEVAAALVAQALSLKARSNVREETDGRAKRDREAMARAERLLNIGFWEFDPATSAFTWYPEARRLLGIEIENALRRRQKNPIIARLQDRIRRANGTEAFVHTFRIFSDGGTEQHFEALGEVRSPDNGSSFGFIRKVYGPANDFAGSPDEDLLTELPSRRTLGIRLSDSVLKRGTTGALVFLDVNRFGDMNTVRGPDFGDAFLRAFAKRLREAAPRDFAARIGNNEFALLLEDIPEEQAANRACAFVGGMRPLRVFGQDVPVELSVGVATFPGDGRGPTELMTNAALALNAAKERGPNSYVRFEPSLREETLRRASLRSEVETGLASGRFVPFYQPKVDVATGEISGFEVLGRWNSPTGLRGPGDFLPALEDSRIAREYFTRQLDRVLADVATWRKDGLKVGRMALNTSPSDYESFDLAGHVLGRLQDARLPASVLGLEITETVILGDNASIKNTLSRLREAGIEIALDDFGTGYASLTHLRLFPIDVVKIDRSFVIDIADDEGSRAIVSAVIDLGHALGLKIVAEGIETPEQVAILRAGSCDEIQGYYYGRPMPPWEVPDFVRSWPTDLTARR